MGYWIGRENWGTGVATRALSAFLDVVSIRPLYAVVATTNVASRRVVEKCGFSVVGKPHMAEDGVEETILKLDH